MAEKPPDPREIDCNIRLYQTGDEDKIVQLLQEVFKSWPKIDIECTPFDHWKWKFIDNPANTDVIPHAVAEYKGKIIGVMHGMLFYAKVGDNPYLSHKGVDVAVDPDFRGMGLFTKMDKVKKKYIEDYKFETSL
ncbi:MAG: GNAT family N-acetyltransferase, partial [Candidatus Bathyarchaeota archaeon]|nr:GNAT family N-acetyltransferase [Candidatus Bathyarchaeota archaeon]